MKKKLFAVALIVFILSILATGTLAYYTSEARAHNVITSNSVGIHIEEYQLVDGELEPYPTDPVPIMPGSTVSKIPVVCNDDADSYIRACVEILIKYEGDRQYTLLTDEEAAEFITLAMNEEDWEYDGQKWWYYTPGVVKSGKSTDSLFTEVSFNGGAMDNDFMSSEIMINIAGQAVQSANNPIPADGTVADVKGWPRN